jgi:hypothetical protein
MDADDRAEIDSVVDELTDVTSTLAELAQKIEREEGLSDKVLTLRHAVENIDGEASNLSELLEKYKA